jgi:hypothetical protein
MIVLPPKDNEIGAEVYVLLAECGGPGDSKYKLDDATTCMQLMDLVLHNRLKKPTDFGAKKGATLIDIIKADGQFRHFEDYPKG